MTNLTTDPRADERGTYCIDEVIGRHGDVVSSSSLVCSGNVVVRITVQVHDDEIKGDQPCRL